MGYQLLTNAYLVAVGIPVILLFSSALARKIVRGPGWQRQDFYLGVQFTLAAMSSALVYIFDLVKQLSLAAPFPTTPIVGKLAATAFFIAITFFFLFVVLSTHQDWERRDDRPTAQLLRLGIFSNLIGSSLLIGFVLLVKGI